jgi:two-component system sensor histidine kinase/response regulator
LGLAICKQLVEKMEGQIWLESQPGQGSRFSLVVHLPRYQGVQESGFIPNIRRDLGSKADVVTPERVKILQELRVLVVDRNASNRRILKAMFGGWGVQATSVADGDLALAQLREGVKRRRSFNLLVFEDRPEHAELSHYAEPGLSKILLVTLGRSPTLDAEKSGIACLLTKPVLATELAEAVIGLGVSEAPSAGPVALSATVNGRGIKILLAEDNMINAKVVSRILESLGFSVVHVANGQLALDELERNPYDLALMDVQMPVLDGLEATRRWRQREASTGRHLIMVALTANAMMGDRERCLEHGMDFYLTKPIHRDRLLEVLNQVRASQSSDVDAGVGELSPLEVV